MFKAISVGSMMPEESNYRIVWAVQESDMRRKFLLFKMGFNSLSAADECAELR